MALFNKPEDLEPLIVPNPKRFPNLSLTGKGKPAAIIALGIITLFLIYYIATTLIPNMIDNLMEQDADCAVIPVNVAFDNPNCDKFGGASVKEALTNGDKTYLLMPTFDNKVAAWSKAADYAWGCGPITFLLTNPVTWELAPRTINGFTPENAGDENRSGLLDFIDIYENDNENHNIKRAAYKDGLDAVSRYLVEYTGQTTYEYSLGKGD